MFLVSITLVNHPVTAIFWFSGLKIITNSFPTVIMTNDDLAYIEGDSITEVKKFVFSISLEKWGEDSKDFNVSNNVNDEKSFFMFSKQDIENAKSGGKKCDVIANKEYKLSEYQTMCENLYNDINTRIINFSKIVTVKLYLGYFYISLISGKKADSIYSEEAKTLINLVKVNPKTYPVKSHFFEISYINSIYIRNDKIISFLYEVDGTANLNGSIETGNIINWVDKNEYSEITIKRLSGYSNIVTKIYSLSPNADIVHYEGIYESGNNIFLSLIGESKTEEYIEDYITLRLTNLQESIEYNNKLKMKIKNLTDDKANKKIKSSIVDSWFYEDVTSDYYKGYFISGKDFIYVEKTKSNDVKVLEKITVEKKIDLTITLPTIIISDADNEMKITLKETIEGCDSKTPYQMYVYFII